MTFRSVRRFFPVRLHAKHLDEHFEELLGTVTGPLVERHLHVGELLIDVLQERDDEVDQLLQDHLLDVDVRDEEGDVVPLDRLPPQDSELARALAQEAHEHLAEQLVNVVVLFWMSVSLFHRKNSRSHANGIESCVAQEPDYRCDFLEDGQTTLECELIAIPEMFFANCNSSKPL